MDTTAPLPGRHYRGSLVAIVVAPRGLAPIRAALTSILVILMIGIAAPSWAQTATTFDELSLRLKPHDSIWFTDAEGRHAGTFDKVLPDALVLNVDGEARIHAASGIREIGVRGPTHKLAGALIGLGAGAAVGFAIGNASEPDFIFSRGSLRLIGALFFGPLGAGVGTVVGCVVRGKGRIVYQAPPRVSGSALILAPIVLPRAKGVALTVRF